MHKVDLAAGAGLAVVCSKCKTKVFVKQNKGPLPTSLAFNHPEQRLTTTCQSCGENIEWTPSAAKVTFEFV